jgi:transposase
VLQDAGKLTSVASETLGISARAMLDELISGNHDPKALADLARGRLRSKLAQLEEALEGHFVPEHHGFMISHILSHIDYIDETIEHLSARIDEVVAPFSNKVDLLNTIPGVDQRTAEVIVAEIGIDMGQFPSAAHLASWDGICPGNNESAGRHKSGRTPQRLQVAAQGLTQAAKAGARSKDTYIRVRHTRIRARRGPAKPRVPLGTTSLSPPTTSSRRACPIKNSGWSITSSAVIQTSSEPRDSYASSSSSVIRSCSSRSVKGVT